MKKYIFITFMALALLGCDDEQIVDSPFATTMIKASHFNTDQSEYRQGESVSCSFTLNNDTDLPSTISDITIKVIDLSIPSTPVLSQSSLNRSITIDKNSSEVVEANDFFTVPADIAAGTSCGITLSCIFEDGIQTTINGSYFRIVDDNTLTLYKIDKENYQGLDVMKLMGGMSAELGVEKSLAALTGSISHSWYNKDNGSGPEPVLMTPDFLQRSLQKTVDLYNEALGANTPIETVVIGTGVPALNYLTNATKAVYLPIHFLGAANTAREVQSVLDYANENGHPSYATLGYDGSIADIGVAWVKLLDLPEEYKQFLNDHQVKNVILFGVGEEVIGESYARKVLTEHRTAEYGARSLYLQYTQYGSADDIAALTSRIYDFTSLNLDENRLIADWESGIIDTQIENFTKSLKAGTSAQPYLLTCSSDMIALYDLGSYLSVHYIEKNKSLLSAPYVNGVCYNEYLVCMPAYETIKGFVPLLYWQFTSPSNTNGRATGMLKNELAAHYPDIAFNRLKFFLNSGYNKENFYEGLVNFGIPSANIYQRGDQIIWNPSDGMSAPCEMAATDIVNNIGVDNYKAQQQALIPLSIGELATLTGEISGVEFSSL